MKEIVADHYSLIMGHKRENAKPWKVLRPAV